MVSVAACQLGRAVCADARLQLFLQAAPDARVSHLETYALSRSRIGAVCGGQERAHGAGQVQAQEWVRAGATSKNCWSGSGCHRSGSTRTPASRASRPRPETCLNMPVYPYSMADS